jgi:hypothetical protein
MSSEQLPINAGVMRSLHAHAAKNPDREFPALLLSGENGPITGAYFLPAVTATGEYACASPASIAQAVRDIRAAGHWPRGLAHSHARHAVFHSATDLATIFRLLPALARPRRIAGDEGVPRLVDQDRAVVPLEDGRQLVVRLQGTYVSELDAHRRAAWSFIECRISAGGEPSVVHAGQHVTISGGSVSMRLGIPDGASIQQHVEDGPVRYAVAYSLVVNALGESFAEAVVACDVEGHSFVEKVPCKIELCGADDTCQVVVNKDSLLQVAVEDVDHEGHRRCGTLSRTWKGNGRATH